MVKMGDIRKLARRIAAEVKPRRIILFGSYAYGEPTEDSDVDLFVVLPFKGAEVRKAAQIRLAVPAPFPLDLIVRTPASVRKRLAMGDPFVQDVLEKGRVLYETARP